MNKNRYRIIFNKARGLLMAVAEIASAGGKHTAQGGAAPHQPRDLAPCALARLKAMAYGLLLALGAQAFLVPLTHAQIVAYKAAPASQRPIILNAGNGVPLINIQTPSAAGVSRNLYDQFDVQQHGAILNNARTNTKTQLGGWVQGNPWLATGTARVILNEVISANPSQLLGYLEVAGNSAQVVIANPAGVTCSGCGFINANRVTLTTGSPIISGGNLDGYRVDGGAIRIQGSGLDASGATHTDLIARAVELNAGLWANTLKISTGTNRVNTEHTQTTALAASGAAPAHALDVAQLGGMYAGKITLVGTEAGVGVRNAGQIGASAGEVILTVDGRLQNSGRITSAGSTQITTTGGIDNSGTVYAQGDASLATRGHIDNSGLIAAQGNTTLSATGVGSRISGTSVSVLGAGINADGSFGGSARLDVSASEQIALHGQNLSSGDQTITAHTLDLSDSQGSANNLTLTATAGNLDARRAVLDATGTLNASATQTLVHDNASSSAQQVQLAAHDLSNVQGELIQTGNGDTAITLAGRLDNTQGRLATNSGNFSLTAQTIDNTDGSIIHAGVGALSLTANTLASTRGSLGSNGRLELAAQTATLDAGIAIADQVRIDTVTLSNRGGQIVQNGTGNTVVNATNHFDNTGGTLTSAGETAVTLGSLDSQGGTLTSTHGARFTLTASGIVDNTTGFIGGEGDVALVAQEFRNNQGRITAGQALQATTVRAIDNTQGLLVANGHVTLRSVGLNNAQGTIGSVLDNVVADAGTGAITNNAGRIEAAQSLTLTSTGLANADGTIVAQNLQIDSRSQALDNTRGSLAASGTLDLSSGALNNDAGLIQASGALAVDTNGRTLTNINSGASAGILGQSTVNLSSGDLNNSAGFIAAKDMLTLSSAAITNTAGARLSSEHDIQITGTRLDNQGGQLQALGSATVQISGTLDNTASLIRAGQGVNLAANQVINRNTQGVDQGIEGQSLTVTANQIGSALPAVDNRTGALRAGNMLALTSGGTLDNSGGLISSANTLTILDPNATASGNASSKTLTVTNTGGTLIADRQLTVDSKSLTGDGALLSRGDVSVKLLDDYMHAGALAKFAANGNATLETAGTLTNLARMEAGNSLTLKAATLNNAPTGEIVASTVNLTATANHTLTNRGLIDGANTFIDSATVNNLGTGRIYGDHVAIAATTLTNEAESVSGVTSAPVIAARARLDIGVTTINNREHGLLFSAGDLAIGGALDASHQATGQAITLNNASATIESLGNLSLSASQINNTNEHFSTTVQALGSTSVVEYQGSGSPNRYLAGTSGVYVYNDESDHLMTPEGAYESWLSYNYTRTTTETQVLTTDPSKILAGGSLGLTATTLLNSNSQIIAGGTLTGAIGTLSNSETPGERTFTDAGTVTSYWRDHEKGRDSTGSSSAAYSPPTTIQAIALGTTVYRANGTPTLTASAPAALTLGSVGTHAAGVNAASATVGSGRTVARLTEVAALTGSTAGIPMVIRRVTPNLTLPDNRLFNRQLNPAGRYLIETDPRFASYRTWISSDYMLSAFKLDPALTQKRLGDGFYEQRLLSEQVAQLTGRRFLDGYANNEDQYRALMDAGVTYAQTWHLIPGVDLTAAQMAALTTDIVWLVEKDIDLGNGQSAKALVPQLYARLRDGDLAPSGALIAGNDIDLNLTGDLTNSGTIAGRQIVSLTAENISNLGGRISGQNALIAARGDLTNLGGTLTAENRLIATAGHNLTVASTTRTQTNAQGSRTNIERVAGLYVTGSNGTLIASAGNDLTLLAAAIVNANPTAAGVSATANATPLGGTLLSAGHDLTLGTVSEAASNRIAWDGKNRRSDAHQADVGTTIQTTGDLTLYAGNDLTAKAASVTSAQGALSVLAERDLTLTVGHSSDQVDEAHQHKEKGLLSSKTITTRDTLDQTAALASTFSGNTTTVQAGQDIQITGSNVVATGDTTLSAGRKLSIEAASETRNETHFKKTTQSGIFSSGGVGFTIGSKMLSIDQKTDGTTAAASTIGSTDGNVLLHAGTAYRQVGSDLIAPQGSIDIAAQSVDILEARETTRTTVETKTKQSGFTLAITSPIISAIQTAQQMSAAASDTKDSRMKLLAAANTGLSGYNAYDAVKTGQGTTIGGKDNQMPVTDATGKVTGSRDATAGEKVGGINVSISYGSSSSRSTSTQTADTARGSSLTAGQDIHITATGAGKDSDLTVQGANLTAGHNLTLKAEDEIRLLAAQNTAEQHSSNKNSSASVGVSYGTDGLLLNVGASGGKGKADGNDLTWSNTHVTAGNTLSLDSGSDTTLKGAVASGDQVIAKVGGDLTIESLQDSATYNSKQQSLGVSLSVGMGRMSGSVSASKSTINSDFASVTEQSGLKAGDKGYQVEAEGKTDLKGAVIASTQTAVDEGKNSVKTASLTTSDIQNKASARAKSSGFSLGSDMLTQGKYGLAKGAIGNLLNNGSNSGSSSGVTRSAVSAGKVVIADEAKQKALTGKTGNETIARLNRDTANAQTAAGRLDYQAMEKTAKAEQAIKNATFAAVVSVVDDGIKKFLNPSLYKVFCVEQPCTNDQVANNQKIADIAKGILESDSRLTPDEARKQAIEQITGPAGRPDRADPVLAQSDPNRLVKIDNPITGETVSVRNVQTVPVGIDSLSSLSDEQKAGSSVFNNGIFNNLPRAAELAQQQTPTLPLDMIVQTGNTTGSTYLAFTDKANNAIGELVVAGIEKAAEVFGIITPAAALTGDARIALSTRYDDQGRPVTDISLNGVSQSRGTMTDVGVSNYLSAKQFYNPNLMIIANNPAADGTRLVEGGSKITNPSNISIYAPSNDPIACFVGGYSCDYAAAIMAIPSVYGTANSVHSSANTGAVGSNSADVNHPFSYNGLNIDQLNAARAAQTNANLLQLFYQSPVNNQAAMSNTLSSFDLQMQANFRAQTLSNLLNPATAPILIRRPAQVSQDSRLNALKAFQQ